MKRLRLSLFALGVLVAVVLAPACGRREAPAPPAATISRHLAGDPPTLDPITMNEEESARVIAMMFRPLISIDKELKLVPGLAKSWSVSDDGLVYEFHLDPAATWEDGKPVTSDDVRFTIERIHDPKANAANWSWGFEDLAGDRDARTRRRCASVSRNRTPSESSPSSCRSCRRPPTLGRSPATSIAIPWGAGRTGSPPGIPTGRSG